MIYFDDEQKEFYDKVYSGTNFFENYNYSSNRVHFDNDCNMHEWIRKYKTLTSHLDKEKICDEILSSVIAKVESRGFIVNKFYKQSIRSPLLEGMLRMTPMIHGADKANIREELYYLIVNSNIRLNLLLDRVTKTEERAYGFLSKRDDSGPDYTTFTSYGDDITTCEDITMKEWINTMSERDITNRINNSNYLIYKSTQDLHKYYGAEYELYSNLLKTRMLRATRIIISVITSYDMYTSVSGFSELKNYSALAYITFYLKSQIDVNKEWVYKNVVNDGLSQILNGVDEVGKSYPSLI